MSSLDGLTEEEKKKCREALIKFFTTKPNIKIEGKREEDEKR